MGILACSCIGAPRRKASSIHPEVLSFHPLEGFFFVIENHTADFLDWFGGVLFGKLNELLVQGCASRQCWGLQQTQCRDPTVAFRSEVHTSELQSLMRISYAVICL